MRKLVLLIALIFVISGCSFILYGDKGKAFADDITTVAAIDKEKSATLDLSTLIAKLPCLNQAVLYSWESNQVKYAMSFTVVSLFNEYLNIDAMYVPTSEVGALASIKLFNLGKWIKFPLLEYIEFQPFIYFGMKNIGSGGDLLDSDIDYGAGAKIISIKF